MGRAVILVFFVLGFVIFLGIKYAAVGLKAAYKAVNDPENFRSELAEAQLGADLKLAEIACSSLGVQVALMDGENPHNVPQQARDNWSLGYVLGFSRALSGNARNAPGAQDRVPPVVFRVLFGDGRGYQLYDRARSLIANGDGATREGFRTGQKEVIDWLSSPNAEDTKVPMGWSSHYHGTAAASSLQEFERWASQA